MREKSKIQQLYEWIRFKGKVATFEIDTWGATNHYTCAPRRARDFVVNPILKERYPHITRRKPYNHEKNGHKAPFKIYEYKPIRKEPDGQLVLI